MSSLYFTCVMIILYYAQKYNNEIKHNIQTKYRVED